MNDTRTEEKTLQDNQKWYAKPSTIIHILITIFGMSSWIGVNGIFIELPVLVNTSPESWKLATYLVIIIQTANLVPVVYSLLRKFTSKISESTCIFVMLGIYSFAMILLAFLYNKTSIVVGNEYSIALFVLTFFMAAVSCSSSVLFMPYMRNFKETYLVSYFFGEGLSGFVPSIVALIQSIGESSMCNNNVDITREPYITHLRFSPQYYFLFLFVCLILSSISFFLLEKLSFIQKEKICLNSSKSNNEIVNSSNNEIESFRYNRQRSVLCGDSINENNIIGSEVFLHNYLKKEDTIETPNISFTQNNIKFKFKKLYLYILMSMICLLANGLLPSLQPYSCMSYGNMTYHLSAIFSQIANPTACLLALWFLPQSIKMINFLSIMIFFMSIYVIYLALNSLNVPLLDSNFGKSLVIIIWILLMGLISYIKLIITSVFRRESKKTLFPVGIAMQIGSAFGAIISFILINYTNLLQVNTPCHLDS